MAEKQQVTREKEQLQQELQTANTRAGEWIQQLQQQVSEITIHNQQINIRWLWIVEEGIVWKLPSTRKLVVWKSSVNQSWQQWRAMSLSLSLIRCYHVSFPHDKRLSTTLPVSLWAHSYMVTKAAIVIIIYFLLLLYERVSNKTLSKFFYSYCMPR